MTLIKRILEEFIYVHVVYEKKEHVTLIKLLVWLYVFQFGALTTYYYFFMVVNFKRSTTM